MSDDSKKADELMEENSAMAKFYYARQNRYGSGDFDSIKEVLLHVSEGLDLREKHLLIDEDLDYTHIDIL